MSGRVTTACTADLPHRAVTLMRTRGRLSARVSAPVLALTAATLLACTPKAGAGIVVHKDHYDYYCNTFLMPSGKALVPVSDCHPECWRVQLRSGDDANRDFCIASSRWREVSVGDYFQVRP